MLFKAGGVIFNSDRIIKAEYKDENNETSLYVRLAGGGAGEYSYSLINFEGDDARAVWAALCREAREIQGVKYKP